MTDFKYLNNRQIKETYDYLYDNFMLIPLGGDINDEKMEKIPVLFDFWEAYFEAMRICGRNNKEAINEFFKCIFSEVESRKYEEIISLKEGKDFGFSTGRKNVFLLDRNFYNLAICNPKNSQLQKNFQKHYRKLLRDKKVLRRKAEYIKMGLGIVNYFSGISFSDFVFQKQRENFRMIGFNLDNIRMNYFLNLDAEMNPINFIREHVENNERMFHIIHKNRISPADYAKMKTKEFTKDFIKKYAFIPDQSFKNYYENALRNGIENLLKIKRNVEKAETKDEKGNNKTSFRSFAKNIEDAFSEQDKKIESMLKR